VAISKFLKIVTSAIIFISAQLSEQAKTVNQQQRYDRCEDNY
jgi:hypothetical protein